MLEEDHDDDVDILGEEITEEEEDVLLPIGDGLGQVGTEGEPDGEEDPAAEEAGCKPNAQPPRHSLCVHQATVKVLSLSLV